MPFRLAGKSLSITISQCATTKEQALLNLKTKFCENLNWAVIAQENHKDGGLHLHIGVNLKNRVDYNSPQCLDSIGGKHGNYEIMRNLFNWIQYINKEDKEPVVFGTIDLDSILKKKNSKSNYLAKRVVEGEPLSDLREQEPGFFMIHSKQIEYFANAVRRDELRSRKRGFAELTVTSGGPGAELVQAWLAANVGKPRKFKQLQLFVTAAPNSGKTSLMKMLSEYVNIYWVPMFEDFDDDYENDIYDLVVMDEFKGQRKLTWMNQFTQGGPMKLKRKGSQYLKEDNPPVIVLSNYPLEQCYKNVEDFHLDPFRARFQFVTLENDMYYDEDAVLKNRKFMEMKCVAKE